MVEAYFKVAGFIYFVMGVACLVCAVAGMPVWNSPAHWLSDAAMCSTGVMFCLSQGGRK